MRVSYFKIYVRCVMDFSVPSWRRAKAPHPATRTQPMPGLKQWKWCVKGKDRDGWGLRDAGTHLAFGLQAERACLCAEI